MKTCVFSIVALVIPLCGMSAGEEFLPVIPQPASWRATGGRYVAPRMVRVGGSKAVADRFAKDLSLIGGMPKVAVTTKGDGNISFHIAKEGDFAREGYRIRIDGASIRATAGTRLGLNWAAVTLLQLFSSGKPISCGVIEDRPKYAYRGFMLDVARKKYSMEFLRDLTRNLAYYKFNVFHVHLNDDGVGVFAKGGSYRRFRLECESCPGLASEEFHYTKDEFRAFVKYAATLGVTIIPEIDTPAHSASITEVRPDLASKKYGRDHLQLDNPEVLAFVEKLYAEYLGGPDPVFAGPYFHVGTDEYDKREAEPFRRYTDAVLRMVQKHGKTPCAWGSLTHAAGKTPVIVDGVIMDIWYNGYYHPKAALEDGYKIVSVPDNMLYIVPAVRYYHDYLDCKRLFASWEPCNIRDYTIPSDHPQLLGGKFALWNDISLNGISEDDTFDRVFPAMQTLGEKMWTGARTNLTWEVFSEIAERTLEAPGLNQADRLTGAGMTVGAADKAVGWSQKGGYTVRFSLKPEKARDNVVLFDDGFSKVGLFDGKLGFVRDGIDYVFPCEPEAGKWNELCFTGDPKAVGLCCNGVDYGRSAGKPGSRMWKGKKATYPAPRTLHFPLVRTSESKHLIKGLSVEAGLR